MATRTFAANYDHALDETRVAAYLEGNTYALSNEVEAAAEKAGALAPKGAAKGANAGPADTGL